MKIGLMSYEIAAQSVGELFQKIRDYGATQVQFAFHPFVKGEDCPDAGMGKMPPHIPDPLIEEVARCARSTGVEVAVMTGFWNMIDRDLGARDEGLLRLERLATACNVVGCDVINLCTGSKGRHMWDRVADNDTVKAWLDILSAMEQALAIAERYKVHLGVEVEASNVINTAAKARQLLDAFQSPWLKIVLDGANLFHPGQCRLENAAPILVEAMALLAGDIIAVHGKDVLPGDALNFTYCGNGIVDFDLMLRRLDRLGYQRGIILHGAHAEGEIPPSMENMQAIAARSGRWGRARA